MTVQTVQRGEQPILPPFEDVEIQPGDTIIFAATRATLKKVLSRSESIISKKSHDESDDEGFQNIKPSTSISLAEAVVAPGSSYIGNKGKPNQSSGGFWLYCDWNSKTKSNATYFDDRHIVGAWRCSVASRGSF